MTIEKFKEILRDEHRLKHGCDYAIIHKFGQTYIMSQIGYEHLIREQALRHGIQVTQWVLLSCSP